GVICDGPDWARSHPRTPENGAGMANAFQLEELDRQIAVVTFDIPGKKVNTLGQAVMTELGALVKQLETRTELRGLLFRGKPGQFIAGADLHELGALAFLPKEMVSKGLALGHALFARMARLPFPTVALIDGPCMGGGAELVLAMDERLAANNPQTSI